MTKRTAYSPTNTTVVLLAAGHGKRMLPLTQNTPKPLLKVGERSLIEHHITRLHDLGFRQLVINIAYLGEQIQNQLGDGQAYGVNIRYSDERDTGALETAGGLAKALPLIDSDPFIVINSDIWTDFDFTSLLTPFKSEGRLVMVANPQHNPEGDFAINQDRRLGYKDASETDRNRTFSGIALYRQTLFAKLAKGSQPLAPLLRQAIAKNQLEGIDFKGCWLDIGTPARLAEVNLDQGNKVS